MGRNNGVQKGATLHQFYYRDGYKTFIAFCLVLLAVLLTGNILTAAYSPPVGAWMSTAVGIIGSWILFYMFFTEKSVMVLFNRNQDTITIFRYFAFDRKEVQVERLSELENVCPVIVKSLFGQQQGYNIVLQLKDFRRIELFTSDESEFQVYVE